MVDKLHTRSRKDGGGALDEGTSTADIVPTLMQARKTAKQTEKPVVVHIHITAEGQLHTVAIAEHRSDGGCSTCEHCLVEQDDATKDDPDCIAADKAGKPCKCGA